MAVIWQVALQTSSGLWVTLLTLSSMLPQEKQARVFGLFGAMYSGFLPLGMLLFGPLADVVQIQHLVLVCGVLLLLLGVFAFPAKKF